MKRRWFAIVGTVVLVLDVVLAQGVEQSPTAVATVTLVGAGGVLLILGGLGAFGGAVPWYRLVGVAEVLFGLVFVVTWVPPAFQGDPTTRQVVLAAVGAVNGLVLGLVGIDWINGGGFFDLSNYEPGPIFGGSGTADSAVAEPDEADEPPD